MKRNFGKNISGSLRQVKEDMRELQRLMRHKSVYAKVAIREYTLRPKHKKRFDDLYEGMSRY